jgi:hypothetical protein
MKLLHGSLTARSRKREVKVLAAVALAVAWLTTAATAAAQTPRTDAVSHAGLPSVLPNSNAAAPAPGQDVSVTTPPPPSADQLTGDSLYQFVTHHATVHYVSSATARNLARWRGGKQSICPVTVGLTPQYNAYVTARLRAIGTYVGAPVQADPACKPNVQIVFTNNPAQSMDAVVEWATRAFGIRYSGGMKDLIEYKGDHAVQGFYITTWGGSVVQNTDLLLVRLEVDPLWPRVGQEYLGNGRAGSRLGGDPGSGIGIGVVILVVDTTKIGSYAIGTLADYVSMLTLSLAQSPDHCDALPSILDLMSSNCATHDKPTAITAGDLAFLKALYFRDSGLGPSLSKAAIQANMMGQFAAR